MLSLEILVINFVDKNIHYKDWFSLRKLTSKRMTWGNGHTRQNGLDPVKDDGDGEKGRQFGDGISDSATAGEDVADHMTKCDYDYTE